MYAVTLTANIQRFKLSFLFIYYMPLYAIVAVSVQAFVELQDLTAVRIGSYDFNPTLALRLSTDAQVIFYGIFFLF